MDAKEISHHAKEIEKLHRNGNYSDIAPLLSLLLDAQVFLEHLQSSDIVQVLYRLVKSCPETNVRKTSKVLLSKWKKLYSHVHKQICKQTLAAEPAKSEADGSTELLPMSLSALNKPGCELAIGDAQSIFQHDSQSEGECKDWNVELQAHPEVSSGSETDGQKIDLSMGEESTEITSRQVDSETPPANISSEPCPVRRKCVQLLEEALTPEKDSEIEHTSDTLAALACNIENHIHAVHGKNMPKYKACVRSKMANLRNPKCSHLRQGLLLGSLTPKEFVCMSAQDMAGEELRREREAYVAAGINECQLPHGVEGTRTRKLRCRRCQGMDCRVTQISRGTLFLPAWVRQGNPGEEAMTFVTCSGCGQQWYQSGWVCF